MSDVPQTQDAPATRVSGVMPSVVSALLLIALIGMCGVQLYLFVGTKLFRLMSDEFHFIFHIYTVLTSGAPLEANRMSYAAFANFVGGLLGVLGVSGVGATVFALKAGLVLAFVTLLWASARQLDWAKPSLRTLVSVAMLVFAIGFAGVSARVIEIRPDVLSTTLLSLALLWIFQISTLADRPNQLWFSGGRLVTVIGVSALLGASAIVSVRTGVFIALISPALVWFYARYLQEDFGTLLRDILTAALTLAALMLVLGFNPVSFLDAFFNARLPASSPPHSTEFSFFRFAMLPMTVLSAGLLIYALAGLAIGHQRFQHGLIAIMAVAQLALIQIDARPFEYAYGNILPLLLIFVLTASRSPIRQGVAGVIILALGGYSTAHIILEGQGRFGRGIYSVNYDLTPPDYSQLSVQGLLDEMLNTSEPNIRQQVAAREALCARLEGRVVSRFHSQPLCLPSALPAERYGTHVRANANVENSDAINDVLLDAIAQPDTVLVVLGSGDWNPVVLDALSSDESWIVDPRYALRRRLADA